jgi:hypothetical protein
MVGAICRVLSVECHHLGDVPTVWRGEPEIGLFDFNLPENALAVMWQINR